MSYPLVPFLFGLVVGALAVLVGGGLAVIAIAWRATTPPTRPPRDPEFDALLRRAAERAGGWYDEMCRDCGGIGGHVLGCPQMDRAR